MSAADEPGANGDLPTSASASASTRSCNDTVTHSPSNDTVTHSNDTHSPSNDAHSLPHSHVHGHLDLPAHPHDEKEEEEEEEEEEVDEPREAYADPLVAALHRAMASGTLGTERQPPSLRVFGAVVAILLPLDHAPLRAAYADLTRRLAELNPESVHVYPREHLHITVASIINFKSPLSSALARAHDDTRAAVIATVRGALVRAFCAADAEEMRPPHSSDRHCDAHADTAHTAHTADTVTDAHTLACTHADTAHTADTVTDCDAHALTVASSPPFACPHAPLPSPSELRFPFRSFEVTLGRPRLSSAAGYFWVSDGGGAVLRLRHRVRRALRDPALAEAGITAALAASHVPDIVHSSFLRFRAPTREPFAQIARQFRQLCAAWRPVAVRVDRVHLIVEDAPYMHIPKDPSRLVCTFRASDCDCDCDCGLR